MQNKSSFIQSTGKEDNLIELEAIKTQTWHKKPLNEAFEELGYRDTYSQVDDSFFANIGHKSYKNAYTDLGDEIYKKLGYPNNPK